MSTAAAPINADARSPEALARASANLRKHALSARDLIIANPNEQTEFEEMLELHLAQTVPNGSVEHTIFDEMIAAAWNLRRMRRLETALNQGIDPVAALDDLKLQAKLDRVARNQARIERSYFKALKELASIQTERFLRRIHPEARVMIDYSPLFNSTEIRKAAKPPSTSSPSSVFSERTQSHHRPPASLAIVKA